MLMRPLAYVALAPVSDVLDMLTLLSSRQDIALALGVIVLFAAWRVARARSKPARSHVIAGATLLGVLVLLFAAAALLPRPMAALVANNVNLVRIDFHSHTSASQDGHGDSEHNRAWHRDGGYDVAYVTDHYAVREAERGMALNANPAAEGVMLLQGIEVNWKGEHIGIPGADHRVEPSTQPRPTSAYGERTGYSRRACHRDRERFAGGCRQDAKESRRHCNTRAPPPDRAYDGKR
jgi:hypothetical protein